MRIAGIIAEYNPFHLGHAYQIAETRRRLGGDCGIVCVMSGNFVQRGQAAVLDKWARAECALLGGADLVLELPTPWAISSAEGFARRAVEALAGPGVVDVLSFGCEDGRLDSLGLAADCLLSPEYREKLRRELERGCAPAALERCERAVLARLRGMTEADFAALPDGGGAEGLSRRMAAAVREGTSIEAVCALAKTKRYALSRIRRLVLWAF